MIIHYSKLPAIVNAIETAVFDQKKWIALDARIQAPAVTDLHFFADKPDALDFREFNQTMQREVTLLPAIVTLDAIHVSVSARLNEGEQQPNIQLDEKELLETHHRYEMMLVLSALSEEMDSFDWTKVFYDPLEANTEAESFEDKIAFNRLEMLVENLSAFATVDGFTKGLATKLMNRYWKDQPMEVQITGVLNGAYLARNRPDTILNEPGATYPHDPDANPLYHTDGNAFTDALVDHWE